MPSLGQGPCPFTSLLMSFLICLRTCGFAVCVGLAICFVHVSTVVYNGVVSEEPTLASVSQQEGHGLHVEFTPHV